MRFGFATAAAVATATLAASANAHWYHGGAQIILDPKAPAYTLSRSVRDTSKLEWHNNTNWLGQIVDFKLIKPLFDKLNASSKAYPLMSRGESHVTVLTPPEFNQLATVNVTIADVNAAAKKFEIQKSPIRPVCLGRERVNTTAGFKEVFQVIVEKPRNHLAIRRELFAKYRKNGGEGSLFDPESYWPHITVGFNVSDVFLADSPTGSGLYKGYSACWAKIDL
ncbi:hypothetical protein GQ42DRAFT_161102, partial [Ramicandelaber brevisporus]